MDDNKDQKAQELTKYGVSCKCANGSRPKELEKTAEAGKLKCPYCGQGWLDSGTDENASYTKP